jgi:hypothetical protein
MLRGLEFGIVVPSGAEWYVLVPKMCPYCVRPRNLFAERPVGRIVTHDEETADLGPGNVLPAGFSARANMKINARLALSRDY